MTRVARFSRQLDSPGCPESCCQEGSYRRDVACVGLGDEAAAATHVESHREGVSSARRARPAEARFADEQVDAQVVTWAG